MCVYVCLGKREQVRDRRGRERERDDKNRKREREYERTIGDIMWNKD